MLLSAIFLAMGSVATSVLNSHRSVRGGGRRAERLQPRDHRRDAAALPVDGHHRCRHRRRRRGRRPRAGPAAAVGAASASATRRGSTRADPQARKALALMVPRAIGLGASQITFVVVTSIATTLGRRCRHRVHRRLHPAPDPDRRDRRPARRRADAVAVARGRDRSRGRVRLAADPGPAGHRVRHAADRGHRGHPADRSGHAPVRVRLHAGRHRPDRRDALRVPRRASWPTRSSPSWPGPSTPARTR